MPAKDVSKPILRKMANRISVIPFQTIYSSADILFGKEKMRFGDPRLDETLHFLTNVSLQNAIILNDIERGQVLLIDNNELSSMPLLMNSQEQRIFVVDYLLNIQQQHPRCTLYQALAKMLTDILFNCLLMASSNEGILIAENNLVVFARFLLEKIQNKIKKGTLPSNLEAMEIKTDTHLQDYILKEIDLAAIYQQMKVHMEEMNLLHVSGQCNTIGFFARPLTETQSKNHCEELQNIAINLVK